MSAPVIETQSAGVDTVLPLKIDRNETFKVQRRFMNLNRLRLGRVYDSLGSHQRVFFDLLPLLFHTNHALMPGYVDKDCPSGLSDYTPGKQALTAAAKLARSFALRKGAVRQVNIHAIYLMGSSGSIAQSSQSDFDLWLCHRKGLETAEIDKLRRKAGAVESWAATLGLEVHIFLMSAELFKSGQVEQLSTESSGTAQRYLLLDEFYRTGLLVEGRPPLWWLVPPELEQEYAEFISTMVHHRFIDAEDYIDFGTVTDIEPAEFFGATLWQIAKAIGAPHKSLLKILLLEAYAADHPRLDLLSARYKAAVYAGEKSPEKLDPYLLLYEKVEEHLLNQGDERRLELARRCLYFKVGRTMRHIAAGADWSCEVMSTLVESWGWSNTELAILDRRSQWKVDRTLEERKSVVNALTHSYKSLSRFARAHSLHGSLSERDMTILGRKLFTAFEHKAGKIDVVNLGISRDLSESHLHLELQSKEEQRPYWLVYREAHRAGSIRARRALHRSWSLVELIAWCHFNGLIGPTTRLIVATGDSECAGRDASIVISTLQRRFPSVLVSGSSVDALARPAYLVQAGTFVNFGAAALAKDGVDATVVTSDRSDALNYSAWGTILVHDLDYVVVTSWGEILVKSYESVAGLMSCLGEHLSWLSKSRGAPSPPKLTHAAAARYENTITKRLSELFVSVTRWFFAATHAPRNRYVLRAGEQFNVLLSEEGTPRHEFSGGWTELLVHLEHPASAFTTTSFDEHALEVAPLDSIFAANKPALVQLFYWIRDTSATIYVLDENGALLIDELEGVMESTLLSHFSQFFDAIALRQSAANTHESTIELALGGVEYYTVSVADDGRFLVEQVRDQNLHSSDFFNLQVIAERVSGETTFTIYCSGREFSTREFGNQLFAVVTEHVLSLRNESRPYPIHITDIDLSALAAGETTEGPLRTMHFLQSKKKIEHRLNEFLEHRAATPMTYWDPTSPEG